MVVHPALWGVCIPFPSLFTISSRYNLISNSLALFTRLPHCGLIHQQLLFEGSGYDKSWGLFRMIVLAHESLLSRHYGDAAPQSSSFTENPRWRATKYFHPNWHAHKSFNSASFITIYNGDSPRQPIHSERFESQLNYCNDMSTSLQAVDSHIKEQDYIE